MKRQADTQRSFANSNNTCELTLYERKRWYIELLTPDEENHLQKGTETVTPGVTNPVRVESPSN